ncbi:uncharacterized protein LOC8282528 [Ricinus communis]|uniref:DUF7722 domain-containing protein n=1 Tax=Ricinus communis TaxID=3988 RepID=B9SA77_RICCO|nr:uncharacterized protein LOC8282528 [Ricinus communis]EEF39496.1 conserved hypothetical protein [Ricinus communis]|eukprot:XP_015577098.1 uncharacterized protein LOC8282528 [Ricinus communis]
MALRWLLHSACHVLGYPNNEASYRQGSHVLGYPNEQHANGVMKSGKPIAEMEVKMETYPSGGFQLPLHYPRYTKTDYQKMEEWRVDMLLREYGLSIKGTLEEKRAFAMGTFLWPDQY